MSGKLNLTVPTLQTPGPAYASIINTDLNQIIPHNHDGINGGASINIAGQIIQDDLSLDGYNLSNIRALQFLSQPSVLSGSQDVNALYVNQNNLGFNNSNGVFVPITDGNSIAVTTLPFTNFDPRTVSSNFTILNTDTYNLIDIVTTGGPVTGTLPICATIAPQAQGRLFIFRDISGFAAINNITIQVAVGSGNTFADDSSTSFVIKNGGGYVAFYTDGVSKWFSWTQNAFQNEQVFMNAGTLQIDNGGELALTGSSSMQVDSSSSIGISGDLITSSGATVFIGGTTWTMANSTHLTWASNSTETHATSVTDTYQAGSNLVLDGSINGVTTGGSVSFAGTAISTNTLLLSGTTSNIGTFSNGGVMNQNATLNLNSNNTNLTGHMNVNGGQIFLNAALLYCDDNSFISNLGFLNEFGVNTVCTTLTGGTYNIDSSTTGGNAYKDNYIAINVGTGGVLTINLPANPAVGRRLFFQDVSTVSQDSPTSWQVTINGNGHNLSNNGTPAAPIYFGGTVPNYVLSNPAGDGIQPYWSIELIFVNNLWIATNYGI